MLTDSKAIALHGLPITDTQPALKAVKFLYFRLNYVRIQRTRSPNQDTDKIYFSARVGQTEPQPPLIHDLGNVGTGQYPVDAQIGPFYIQDQANPVVIVAQVVNSASTADRLEGQLIQAG